MGPWHRHQSPVITPAKEGICANRDRCGGRASCRGWGLHGQPQTPPGRPDPPCQQPALQGLPSSRAGLLVSRMWVPAPLTPRPALSPQAGWRTGPWGELASHLCSSESSGHCARPLQAGPLTMRTSWRGSSSPLDIRVLGPSPGAVLSQWGMSGLCPRPAVAGLNLGGDALCLWAAGQGSEGLLDASLDAASRSASQVATPAQRADGS